MKALRDKKTGQVVVGGSDVVYNLRLKFQSDTWEAVELEEEKPAPKKRTRRKKATPPPTEE